MQTLLEILRKSEEFLAGKGVPEARLDAEHLLAHHLQCSRMQIYLQFERPLTEDLLTALRKDILRRSHREPLAYILGSAPFFDFNLKVGEGVLIPRPETEELVEKLSDHYPGTPTSVVDFCTGCGAIALWLKKTYPQSDVRGVDLSIEALNYAQENGKNHQLDINWICDDWRNHVDTPYDLIVSNPPYLKEAEWSEAELEVRIHEPKLALVAGEEGAKELILLIRKSHAALNKEGMLALETGIDHEEKLVQIAEETGYSKVVAEKDISGRSRFLFCWK